MYETISNFVRMFYQYENEEEGRGGKRWEEGKNQTFE